MEPQPHPFSAPTLFFTALEEDIAQTTGEGRLLRCQPCPEGCTGCVDDTPCLVQEALALRAAVLACQACCMLAVFLSMVISYHRRWSKASCPS